MDSGASQHTPLGLRTNMVDASGSTAYAYDVRNRLIQKLKTWATVGLSVALNYAYDASGNLTNIVSSSPNGVEVAYEYDTLNRLNAVNDAKVGRTSYTYDEVGNLKGYTYPNSVHAEHAYDALNRLTNLAGSRLLTAIANYAYAVGPSGNRTNATEELFASALNSHPSTINRLYTYDDIYRLTGETINGAPAVGYGYDPIGNRLSRTSVLPELPAQNFGYDSNDRLNTDTYDNNGNTLVGRLPSVGVVQDTYDFENRLVTRHSPLATIHLVYDGDGNRVTKTVVTATNTLSTYYVVDDQNPTGYAQVLEEHVSIDSQPVAIDRVYAYGHAQISQDRLDGAQWTTSYYGYDGHNNVRYLTDDLGQVTDTYDYDAFGNLIGRTGTTPNNYLFTGEQYDPDLGLYYLRARYHNPDTGRFWTQDSFEGFGSDPASLHKYAYCGNNPVNAFDPTGNSTIPEISIATGLWATARAIFGGTIGGMTGALVAGYDSILHGRVTDVEIAQAMTVGFKQGAEFGALSGFASSFGSVGVFGISAIGLVYSGIGFHAAYQSYSTGNIDAGDFEAAMAVIMALASAPGVAHGSVMGTRGLTSAMENYIGGPKNFLNVQLVPAELANAKYPQSPPYSGNAIEFETGRPMYFVRIIHIGNMDRPQGGFLTTAESVLGKSRAELKQIFALQGDVVGLQTVKVPAGTKMRAGRVAAQPQWGENSPGNAVQYELIDRIESGNFSGQIIPVNP